MMIPKLEFDANHKPLLHFPTSFNQNTPTDSYQTIQLWSGQTAKLATRPTHLYQHELPVFAAAIPREDPADVKFVTLESEGYTVFLPDAINDVCDGICAYYPSQSGSLPIQDLTNATTAYEQAYSRNGPSFNVPMFGEYTSNFEWNMIQCYSTESPLYTVNDLWLRMMDLHPDFKPPVLNFLFVSSEYQPAAPSLYCALSPYNYASITQVIRPTDFGSYVFDSDVSDPVFASPTKGDIIDDVGVTIASNNYLVNPFASTSSPTLLSKIESVIHPTSGLTPSTSIGISVIESDCVLTDEDTATGLCYMYSSDTVPLGFYPCQQLLGMDDDTQSMYEPAYGGVSTAECNYYGPRISVQYSEDVNYITSDTLQRYSIPGQTSSTHSVIAKYFGLAGTDFRPAIAVCSGCSDDSYLIPQPLYGDHVDGVAYLVPRTQALPIVTPSMSVTFTMRDVISSTHSVTIDDGNVHICDILLSPVVPEGHSVPARNDVTPTDIYVMTAEAFTNLASTHSEFTEKLAERFLYASARGATVKEIITSRFGVLVVDAYRFAKGQDAVWFVSTKGDPSFLVNTVPSTGPAFTDKQLGNFCPLHLPNPWVRRAADETISGGFFRTLVPAVIPSIGEMQELMDLNRNWLYVNYWGYWAHVETNPGMLSFIYRSGDQPAVPLVKTLTWDYLPTEDDLRSDGLLPCVFSSLPSGPVLSRAIGGSLDDNLQTNINVFRRVPFAVTPQIAQLPFFPYSLTRAMCQQMFSYGIRHVVVITKGKSLQAHGYILRSNPGMCRALRLPLDTYSLWMVPTREGDIAKEVPAFVKIFRHRRLYGYIPLQSNGGHVVPVFEMLNYR